VYQATDVNGSVTTYTYGACGEAFPTNVTTGSLSTSASWNCNGGVMTSSTDANGFTTSYNYGSDPFWRVMSVTDPLSNVTSYTYPVSGLNASYATMFFNNNTSISGSLTFYDSLGRVIIQQTPTTTSQSTYNSVQTVYDSHGRPYCQSVPYSAAAGMGATGAYNCTHYDPLNRTSLFKDAGGGTVAYTYNANDVLVTKGPAPSNENAKQRQLEYNGAGWLTSVCEVTSQLPGAGSCGQNTAATGYLTQYTYNGGGNLLTVKQNVQAGQSSTQTRSLTYDGLGRKTSEVIPEWTSTMTTPGTGTYAYDSDPSGVCSGSYPGDLVKSIDNAGNITCYTYDLLHRVLSSTVASGPYASVTPQNNYVYDAATSVLPVRNAKGSLAEAYTSFAGSTMKLTDVYFSKYPSGNSMVSQMWESTPHSNGYLVTQQTTYPNGVLAALSASQVGSSGANATGTVTVSGSEQSYSYIISESNPCAACAQYGCPPCYQYVYGYYYDSGSVGITVNGMSVSTGYGQGSTSSSVAASLASAINSTSSFPVTATASGSVLTLTSTVPGPSINYTVSGSSSNSFAVSSGTVSGGSNAPTIGPAMTYAIDGAGRPYSATDGTNGLNLVTSTAYNAANLPTSVTFGNAATGSNADTDSFGYDPNTNRPTSFTYTVNPTSSTLTVAGNLIWNANGSLQQLAFNDSSDSTKNQTCTYSADDLSRIASVNCGNATWAQNFSYDAFGNINKTVPYNATGGAYTAAYSPITNHVLPGTISPSPAYDAVGNQLNSTGATLTWNAAAQPITVNGTTANYDALGRMVETGATSVPSATYDSGTLTLTVINGVLSCSSSVTYGADSTPASLASQLVNQINANSCTLSWVSAALSGISTVAITNATTIQASSTHSAQFSSPSFSFTASSESPSNGQIGYFGIIGSEQSSVSVPTCAVCNQFFYRPDGAQLGIYSGGLVTETITVPGGSGGSGGPGGPGGSPGGTPPSQEQVSVYVGGLTKETIPLPGGETAVYNGSGLNFIRHKDWLGSSRLATTWAHAVYSKEAYAPFGETYNEAGTPDRSFTGQDQDVATGAGGTGTYDFLFRKYDPAAGRWLSPDPSGWKAVNQAYPQSLNRYAYVQNNPMSLTDPDGLDCAYLSDDGTSVESLDQQSNSYECAQNGGYWVSGAMTDIQINSNTGTVVMTGTLNGTDITAAAYINGSNSLGYFAYAVNADALANGNAAVWNNLPSTDPNSPNYDPSYALAVAIAGQTQGFMNAANCVGAGIASMLPGQQYYIGAPTYTGLGNIPAIVSTGVGGAAKYSGSVAEALPTAAPLAGAVGSIASKASPWLWGFTALNAVASTAECMSGASPTQ
jgi:RHS repeat-associated protein